ncbi:MAG: hypothetical protein IMY86_09895, partial [Chloroflexi bacterium]|nr:hypothetical protein [Chloroflexota bacterium]
MPDLTSDSQAEQQVAEQPETVESQEDLEAVTADEAASLPEEEETATADEAASLPEEEETATADEAASLPEEEAAEEKAPSSEEEETTTAEEAEPEEETPPAGPSLGQRLGTAFSALGGKLGATLAPVRERLSTTFAPVRKRLSATFAPVRERLGSGARAYGVYVLIGMLVIIATFLPPISLLQRLGIVGYTTINAKNISVSHPDGVTVRVDPETFTGKLRVLLDSVPREDFEGFAHSPLRDAAEALLGDYSHLQAKSPLYQIKVRGEPDQPVMIDADMPANAEPWETLDLYTWTGESWQWVGSELHTETAEHEFIRAQVTDVPANLVVMQAGPTTA